VPLSLREDLLRVSEAGWRTGAYWAVHFALGSSFDFGGSRDPGTRRRGLGASMGRS